ncbi:hypothetical protein B566_EDAN003975 [Ephemera danica]|nr:hypothetical protein B566_EDAN003975 [Ephemera danica]
MIVEEVRTSDTDLECAVYNPPKSQICWTDIECVKPIAIAPPPEFQDQEDLKLVWIDKFAKQLVSVLMSEALVASSQVTWAIECSQDCHPILQSTKDRRRDSGPRLCWTPELPFSPGHHRPLSRGSLASSRLSISHNSLTVPSCKADDSSFITLAMSHDVLIGELTASEISDIYNVPFDSDIYAVPIDMVHPSEPKKVAGPIRPKRKPHRKKKRQTSSSSETDRPSITPTRQSSSGLSSRKNQYPVIRSSAETLENSKRHSVPGTCSSKRPGTSRSSTECSTPREPIHMTLQEVRQYLQNLYSSSSDSSERKTEQQQQQQHPLQSSPTPRSRPSSEPAMPAPPPPCAVVSNFSKRPKRNTFITNMKHKKPKDVDSKSNEDKGRKCNSFSASLKQTLCSLFRFRKLPSPEHQTKAVQTKVIEEPPSPSNGLPCPNRNGFANGCMHTEAARPPFSRRALPPLPASSPVPLTDVPPSLGEEVPLLGDDGNAGLTEPVEELSMDFASSIEKVKDYGWYWGPISGETAEKILSSEPDGSFIVRDSSDQHYIFSLTFRLNGCVRHVRIEHDQGNFSFGSCTKFKSHTIVDFIENAVEHSRSGRYLFFLHRRPVLGPMRVQLLHPVSRFKQVQSLQHMCRRDLISTLPLPRRVIDYLSTPHYYAEQELDDAPASSAASSVGSHSDLLSFVPHRPRS